MSSEFLEAANLFTWSCWSEIGVPGSERRSIDLAIDLEPLIRVTGAVGIEDPRLRSHATAWLRAFPELVSKARLKRFGGVTFDADPQVGRLDEMSGSATLDLARSAAIQLRIRSALGVSARAEIIRQFVVDTPRARRSTTDIAQLSGYTRRNAEKALESLERARWIARVRGGASLRWSATDHAMLRGLFAPVPASDTSFMALIEIVEAMLMLDEVGDRGARVRSATARQVLLEQQGTAGWGAITLPIPGPLDDAWKVALAWVAALPASAR